ncbi:hypothetical protein F4778DRAFT_550259 [Xylariomycetidae sp. FL2044]|nr:hypothetical protein F4778DRAFT_550259 [Xylariomycetidae sp. FL2044]
MAEPDAKHKLLFLDDRLLQNTIRPMRRENKDEAESVIRMICDWFMGQNALTYDSNYAFAQRWIEVDQQHVYIDRTSEEKTYWTSWKGTWEKLDTNDVEKRLQEAATHPQEFENLFLKHHDKFTLGDIVPENRNLPSSAFWSDDIPQGESQRLLKGSRKKGWELLLKDIPFEISDPSGNRNIPLRILNICKKTWEKRLEDEDSRPSRFEKAISNLTKPESIKKIVGIGMGSLFERLPRKVSGGYDHYQVGAQISSLLKLRELIQKRNKTPVQLFACDPCYTYGRCNMRALKSHGFQMLDPSRGKHEQFVEIDDTTMVVAYDAEGCPTLNLSLKIARPAAFILESDLENVPTRDYPEREQVASCVKLGNEWKIIPPGLTRRGTQAAFNVLKEEYNMIEGFPYEKYEKFDLVDEENIVSVRYEHDGYPVRRVPIPVQYWSESIRLYERKEAIPE